MATVTEAPVTAPCDEQRALISPHLTTPPLSTPRWRPTLLLRFLQILVPSCARHHAFERPWISPDLPRGETPTEFLARKDPYLYIQAMLG
jgi:hypothetical protein